MAEGYSWHRRYDGTVTDAKFAEAKAISGQSKSLVLATWDCICESANLERRDGAFGWTPRRVAAVLDEPAAAIEAVFAALAELGVIADGVVVNWKKRQKEADPTAAARMAEHRERERLRRLAQQPGRQEAQPELDLAAPGEAGESGCYGAVTARYGGVTDSSESESESESSSSVVVPFPRASAASEEEEEIFLKIKKIFVGRTDDGVCWTGAREVRGWLAEGCELEADVIAELAAIAGKLRGEKRLRGWASWIGRQVRARRNGRLAAQKAREAEPPAAAVFVAEGTLEWTAWAEAGHPGSKKGASVQNGGRVGWWFPSRLPPLRSAGGGGAAPAPSPRLRGGETAGAGAKAEP